MCLIDDEAVANVFSNSARSRQTRRRKAHRFLERASWGAGAVDDQLRAVGKAWGAAAQDMINTELLSQSTKPRDSRHQHRKQ